MGGSMEDTTRISKETVGYKNTVTSDFLKESNTVNSDLKNLDIKQIDFLTKSASGKLQGKIYKQENLTLAIRNQLWALYSFYYDNTEYNTFILDLMDKNYVCLLRDSGNDLIKGFSTIKVYKKTFGKKVINIIFSGDTIVDSEYWGQRSLSTQLFKFFMKLKLKNPTTPVYWFLISKGYKTYLGMTRNFINYWPRYDKETPPLEKKIIQMLAEDKYPKNWIKELGLLKFESCPGKLKSNVAPIDEDLLNDPDINFFHKINPDHAEGDELCCLAQVNFLLTFYYPYRTVKKLLLKYMRGLGFYSKPIYSK
jgi:hypothetical protein